MFRNSIYAYLDHATIVIKRFKKNKNQQHVYILLNEQYVYSKPRL